MAGRQRRWSDPTRLLIAFALSATVLVLAPFAPAARAGVIQDAIDAAPAGGTVTIPAGTFVENLTVTKDLTLEGAGSELAVVQGTGTRAVLTAVTAGVGLTVRCITLTGGDGVCCRGFGLHPAGDSPRPTPRAIVLIEVGSRRQEQVAWGGHILSRGCLLAGSDDREAP